MRRSTPLLLLLLAACAAPGGRPPDGEAEGVFRSARPAEAPRLDPLPAAPPEPPRLAAELDAEAEAWVDSTLASLSLREKVGQMVVAWTSGRPVSETPEEMARLRRAVREAGVGALVISIGTPRDYVERLEALQREARVPLLVTTDMESGPGMRLRPGGTSLPPVMALGAANSDSLARAVGRAIAEEARAAGVHATLAPVLDVNSEPANPIVNVRAFSDDPALAGRMAAAYLRGLHDGRLLAVGKHFPGHGATSEDSHIGLPEVGGTRARLDTVELPPFRAAVRAGLDGMLVGHLAVPALGAETLPASLSPAVVGMLREEMGFDGLVMTDALNMGAVGRWSQGEAVVLGVEAGADLLLQPPDPSAAVDAVLAAVRSGRLTEARIDASVRRILAAKAAVGLHRRAPLDAARAEAAAGSHRAVARAVGARGLVLARDPREIVPFPQGARVLVVSLGGSAGTTMARVLGSRGVRVETARLGSGASAAERAALRRRAAGFDAVVVAADASPRAWSGSIGIDAGLAAWAEGLARDGAPMVLVSLGSPYLIDAVPSAPAYLLAWGGWAAEEAAGRALAGDAPITGRLPVSLGPELPRGTGVMREGGGG